MIDLLQNSKSHAIYDAASSPFIKTQLVRIKAIMNVVFPLIAGCISAYCILKMIDKMIGIDPITELYEEPPEEPYVGPSIEKILSDFRKGPLNAENLQMVMEALESNNKIKEVEFFDARLDRSLLFPNCAHNSTCLILRIRVLEIKMKSNYNYRSKIRLSDLFKDKTLSPTFSCEQIDSNEIRALAKMLKTNKTIKKLAVRSKAVSGLLKALKSNNSVETLDLSYNQIGPEEAGALAEGLKSNDSLRTLDLSFNQMGAEGAEALAGALKSNDSLGTLDLRFNQIGAEGARALAEGLKSNDSLRTLDLSYNRIGGNGIRLIAGVLENNYGIQHLNLENNDTYNDSVSVETRQILVNRALENNRKYQEAYDRARADERNFLLFTHRGNGQSLPPELRAYILRIILIDSLGQYPAAREQLALAENSMVLKKRAPKITRATYHLEIEM